jgi:hypothetical protein
LHITYEVAGDAAFVMGRSTCNTVCSQ